MGVELPPPIEVPWAMKPLSSAETRVEDLPGGRRRYWIRHDVLHGVTPEMLVWWFQHIEGDVEVEGKTWPRYRIWHPRDHIAFRYHRRAPDGGTGAGAVYHIREALNRNPDWVVDVKSTVRRLDEGGFVHQPMRAVLMEYTFSRVPGGTLYENALTLGFSSRLLAPLNWALHRHFGRDRGDAWLLHNVEEVGNFEFFLPALYAKANA